MCTKSKWLKEYMKGKAKQLQGLIKLLDEKEDTGVWEEEDKRTMIDLKVILE